MPDQYEAFEKLIQAGELETAERQLFDWIIDHPNDARGWLLYGKCATSKSQKRKCFTRVISLDPSNTEALRLLEDIDSSVTPIPQKHNQPERVGNIQTPSIPLPPS